MIEITFHTVNLLIEIIIKVNMEILLQCFYQEME